ncbi:hypothetical protein AS859_01885 [Aliarcobacter cryaerophilus]|uniref:TonB C-terminal domain-containing protein n=1 Tax=Aliarcobacter cryaerophilus TaxID=28198 RepID=A0A1V9VDF1_9BACT|nr:hypothetical protein AS859_01885 [Aliarcobacter cryaerophilus]
MKKIVLAFVVSLLIHILLFLNYSFEESAKEETKKDNEKSEVKFVKLVQEKVLQEQTAKSVEPKIDEPKIVEQKQQNIKTPKIVEANNSKKQLDIKEAKKVQKEILKESSNLQDNTLEKFLSQKTPINQEVLNELQKLYGKEYDNFTNVQKAYLEKNLNNFQVITQKVLNRMGYPKLAAKLGIGGINTIEFMFHPNGDISGLKIIGSSGYTILDDYSLELIQIAYKEYPKPTEPTKLRFKVFYRNY